MSRLNRGMPRNRLIGAVHAAAKQRGLEEDDRRALMQRLTGKDSCKAMDMAELARVLDALNGKERPAAARPSPIPSNAYGGKLRALWISGYWLGAIEDRSDEALAAFIKRQTGLDSARFVFASEDANKAIEALKDWLAREAGVSWDSYRGADGKPYQDPRARVIEAQWRRLAELDEVRIASHDALVWWCRKALKLPAQVAVQHMPDATKDEAIRTLGAWLRRAMGADDAEP